MFFHVSHWILWSSSLLWAPCYRKDTAEQMCHAGWWPAASIQPTVPEKDTAGTGGGFFCCLCGTCCTGVLPYFKTHCGTQEQVLALCSCCYCSPKNSVPKCLRTRSRERDGSSANAQKIIGPYALLVEELTTVHSWLKLFIWEKIIFYFLFFFVTMEWVLGRQKWHLKSGVN